MREICLWEILGDGNGDYVFFLFKLNANDVIDDITEETFSNS